MFSVGQKVFRNYPVTSAVEGVIGYTKNKCTVVGPIFDYKGVTYVPITTNWSRTPFLVEASELYTEEKQ